MKSKDKEKLQADLIKYSKQIGVLENEIPRLILDRKEMRSLVTGRIQNSKSIAAYGQCFHAIRTSLIN
jgi:hypothetical protein